MQKKEYQITVTLKSPLHINGGTDADGTRIPVMSDGRPYIPATTLKGILREQFTAYLKMLGPVNCDFETDQPCGCPACQIFGKAGFQPSRLILSNLFTEQQTVLSLRANCAIDRKLQTGKDQMLVFTKVLEPFDKEHQPVRFTGCMTVWYAGSADQIAKTEQLLLLSLKSIIEIGGGKSRGLGYAETEVIQNG